MTELHLFSLAGIPEVHPGDDPEALIMSALETSNRTLQAGDILIITHKIVSKSEGRLVDLQTIVPSPLAQQFADRWQKDARQIEVVLQETNRIVRMDRGIIISETRHGFVCANAGVDASNVPGRTVVCLLPLDPDASARQLSEGITGRVGFSVPVIITDSWGRPWREGIVNVAIGVAGLSPLVDYRGMDDPHGLRLQASILAVADELAAASELVMGKIDGRPVVIARGYHWQAGPGSGHDLLMDPARDMFR